MKYLRLLVLAAVAGTCWLWTGCGPMRVNAGVGMGYAGPPDCPYGYYDYAPYDCAPYGYYGPEWFTNGIFIGAGPWYHGPRRFWGHVDNHYDRHHGYGGPVPRRGEQRDQSHRVDHIENFHGNEMRNGRGHVRGGDRH